MLDGVALRGRRADGIGIADAAGGEDAVPHIGAIKLPVRVGAAAGIAPVEYAHLALAVAVAAYQFTLRVPSMKAASTRNNNSEPSSKALCSDCKMPNSAAYNVAMAVPRPAARCTLCSTDAR